MEEEKFEDIYGISYALCDIIDDFLAQSKNDKEAFEKIKKDKDLSFYAKEIRNYFDNDFKKMDEFYEKSDEWSGYDADAVSDYIKTFFF